VYDMKQDTKQEAKYDDVFDLARCGVLFAQDDAGGFSLPEDAAKILLLPSGTFLCAKDTFYFDGTCGATRMYNVLRLLCHDIPTRVFDMPVTSLRDYQTGIGFDLKKEKTYPLCPMDAQAIALDVQSGSIVLVADEENLCLTLYAAAWHKNRPRAAQILSQMRTFMQNWIMQRA